MQPHTCCYAVVQDPEDGGYPDADLRIWRESDPVGFGTRRSNLGEVRLEVLEKKVCVIYRLAQVRSYTCSTLLNSHIHS